MVDSFSPAERCLLHTYNAFTRQWNKQTTQLQVAREAFASGSFRQAFKAKLHYDGKVNQCVCKFARDPTTAKQLYFADVEAQEVASHFAADFNTAVERCGNPLHVPHILFIRSFVLELVDRSGRPICACEQQLDGPFFKHNNNVGAVTVADGNSACASEAQLHIDLAQCFSHFTYQHSGGQLLICDIQGSKQCWTDPQIHTVTGKHYGLGNIGVTGIRAFLLRHRCNDICQMLKVEKIAAASLNEATVQQTVDSNKRISNKLTSPINTASSQHSNSRRSDSHLNNEQQQRASFDSSSSARSFLPQSSPQHRLSLLQPAINASASRTCFNNSSPSSRSSPSTQSLDKYLNSLNSSELTGKAVSQQTALTAHDEELMKSILAE